MKRALKLAFFAVLVSVALIAMAITWVMTTSSGFQYAIETVERFVPELKIGKAEGRLASAFSLEEIRYAAEAGPLVEIASVQMRWQSMALLRGKAKITELAINDLHIIDRETPATQTDDSEPVEISLPVAIEIESLRLEGLNFTSVEGDVVVILNRLSSQLHLRHSTLSLDSLTVERDDLQLQLAGAVDINPPYSMQFATDISVQLPDLPSLGFSGSIEGDTTLLRVQQNSRSPLEAQLDVELSELLGQLGWQIELAGGQWQVADFVDEQTAQISALKLSANGGLESIDGTLQFNLIEVGLPELALAADFSSSGFDDWIVDIRAGIDGRSELNLAGQINAVLAGNPDFDVAGDWSNIIWPYDDADLLVKDSQGSFSLAGDLDELLIELSAQAELRGDELIPDQQLQLDSRIQASPNHAVIEQLELASDIGRLSAEGRVDWADQLHLSLDSQWQEISIPEGLAPVSIRSPQGNLQLRGDESEFVLNSEMSLEVDQQPLQLTLNGDGDQSGFERFELLIRHAGARAGFTGAITWQDFISVAGDLTLKDFNPGILLADWQGRLDGQGQLGFQLEDDDIQLTANNLRIEGVLRDLPVLLQSELSYQNSALDVPMLALSSGASSLQVKGKMTDVLAFEWQLNSPDLSNFYPELAGQLSANGVLTGHTEKPDITAQLQGQALSWQQYSLGQLTADISVRDGGDGRLQISTQLDNVMLDEFVLEQLSLELSGALDDHALLIKAKAEDIELDSLFVGALHDEVWQGNINRLNFDSDISGLWQLSETGNLMLSASAVSLEQHCWRSSDYGQLCLQAQSDEQMNWQASGNFAELPLALANPFINEFAELSGQLTGQFQLSAEAGAMPTGQVQLEVGQGAVKLSELILDQEQPVNLDTVTLQVNLDQNQTALNFVLQPDMEGFTALDLSVTTADLTTIINAPEQAALSGQLSMAIADLAVLNLGGPAYDDLTGRFTVNARISGDVAQPQVEAEILLAEAAVELIELGILVSAINAEVSGNLDGFALNFSARSGDGELSGSGEFNFVESGWQLHARLDAEQFELMNLPEAYVIASPALRFEATPDALSVRGDVRIPTAELAPLQFNSTVSVSDDVVVLGRELEEQTTSPMATHIDVNVILGDAVRITAMGFNGRLTGQLRVSGDPNALLNGNGEIILTDGSYDAYGQQLRVNDGRIRFSGAAIDNPDLDIRAVRTGTGFTAGIHIHGPADNPQATLFSTPSMSQDNILSHILLGRPLMQANDSDAAFLASAATGLGIRNGAMIGEQIASSFGLDSFSVSGDTPETTAVEIGKYLSPRLYVSYGIGVFEPVSTMQLRYTLSRLFTLRAESGLETGVDLLYTYERR